MHTKFAPSSRSTRPSLSKSGSRPRPLPIPCGAAHSGPTGPESGSAELFRDPVYGAEIVRFEWPSGGERRAEIVSHIATRDRAVDIHAGGERVPPLSSEERALFTKATALIPTDGIVKETSDRIVRGARSDREKARAIYDWLVANTERIAATRGCGSGDISAMLAARKAWRQMRRHQRPVRRARPRGGSSGTRPLRHSRRPFALRLQEPGCRFDRRHQGPALPGRRLA